MSEEKNTESFHQVDLSKVPFRVVICDILCFREFKVKTSTDNNCSLFGYFKYDRTRKIFQIFQCIEVIGSTNEVIDFSRLLRLTLKSIVQSFLDRIISNSNKFINLKGLLIPDFFYVKRNSLYSDADFSNLFSKPGCFPKLENLSIELTKNRAAIDMKDWHNSEDCLRIISQLKTFNLKLQHEKFFETLGQTCFLGVGKWKCLKKFSLFCVSLPHAVIFEAPPTLEYFTQIGSVNFEIKLSSTSRLKYLCIRNCERVLMLRYLMNSHNVEFLALGSSVEYSDWIFEYLSEFKKVKRLTLFRMKFTENPPIERMKLPPNMVKFFVYPNRSFPTQLLETGNYSKLQQVKLFRVNFKHNPLNLPFSNGVEFLRIFGKNIDDSVLFSKNKWENLRILRLLINTSSEDDIIQCLTGDHFTMMPKLEVFAIRSTRFSDSFFQKNRFECLLNLKISKSMNIFGTGWNKTVTSNLRTLEIGRIENLNVDRFFQENEFPFLEILLLREIERKKENHSNNMFQGWNPLSSIKKLMIYHCVGFGDKLFQIMKFGNLETLSMKSSIVTIELGDNANYAMYGKNWNFLPELKFLSLELTVPTVYTTKTSKGIQIEEKDYFGDFFWSDPPFPVSEGDEKERSITVSERGTTTIKVNFTK